MLEAYSELRVSSTVSMMKRLRQRGAWISSLMLEGRLD
jgi:hypothetical protein